VLESAKHHFIVQHTIVLPPYHGLKSCGIHFQHLENELSNAAAEFKATSRFGAAIDGCVACLDGLLLPIQTPCASETGQHVKSYFSGHYQMYGINVQAACDAQSLLWQH
jgi:hypothetical protein